MRPRPIRPAAIGAALAIALVAGAALPAVPALGAPKSACRISLAGPLPSDPSDVVRDLASAVAQAASGATLRVRGRCTGDATITKDLTIVGVRPRGWVAPQLRGSGTDAVLRIFDVTVGISRIAIRGGTGVAAGPTTYGGGIYTAGTLTLTSVDVVGNSATAGGGIANVSTGTLTLRGSTRIRGAADGGGVYSEGTLVVGGRTLITGNQASTTGGGIRTVGSVEIRDDAQVVDNTAGSEGGGIWGGIGGSVVVRHRAVVRGNEAPTGGGLYLLGSTLALHDEARLIGNAALTGSGGGVLVVDAAVTMDGASRIAGNTAVGDGGGIWTNAAVTMSGTSRIVGNTGNIGGGVVLQSAAGILTMSAGSRIRLNTATTAPYAGGVYVGTDASLAGSAVCGTTIEGNTPNDCYPPPS
ncbi:MAG: hypothetical protein ACKOTZ_10750 [Chloroflexota bacterium]